MKLEISALRTDDKEVFNHLVKPTTNHTNQCIHNITNEVVSTADTIDAVLSKFKQFCGSNKPIILAIMPGILILNS